MSTDELAFLVSIRTTLAGEGPLFPGQEAPFAAKNVLLNLKKDFKAEDLDSSKLETQTVQKVDYDGIEARILSLSHSLRF